MLDFKDFQFISPVIEPPAHNHSRNVDGVYSLGSIGVGNLELIPDCDCIITIVSPIHNECICSVRFQG
ncbi:MAG: hypothetical protein ACTSXN_14330 [Promethearchaeota archaeon]